MIDIQNIDSETLGKHIKARADCLLVDIRTVDDFIAGHLPNALHVPRDRWDSLDLLKNMLLMCHSNCKLIIYGSIAIDHAFYFAKLLNNYIERNLATRLDNPEM